MDVGGHAYLPIEGLEGLNATLGGLVGMGEVVGHSHHIDSKLDESAQVLVLYIARP